MGVTAVGFPSDANLDVFESVYKASCDLDPHCMTLISGLLATEQQVIAYDIVTSV